MFNQNTDGLAVFQETARAFQAIAAENGDYAQRLIAEGTAALGQMSSAKSVPEYMDIMTSYSKKAFEDNIQQMTRIASMYTSAANDHARAVQAMLIAGPK